MADFPLYIWILVFAGAAGIPAVTAYGLYRSALANGRGRGRAAALAAGFGGLWAAWIAASAVLAATGAYRPGSGANRPWIAVAAAGVLAVTVAAAATPAARRVLTGTRALAWLTAPQALRVVGISFILAMMLGKLPAAFALPAPRRHRRRHRGAAGCGPAGPRRPARRSVVQRSRHRRPCHRRHAGLPRRARPGPARTDTVDSRPGAAAAGPHPQHGGSAGARAARDGTCPASPAAGASCRCGAP